MTFHILLVATCLSILSAAAGAMDLSGSVLGVDRKPLSGVQVRLLGGNAIATTDALGEWRIQSSTTRIGSREVRRTAQPRAIVVVEGGRLRLRIAGRDHAGRGSGEHHFPIEAALAAGRVQSGPDTLTFSLSSKILLRDTVSTSRTGIVRILDSTFNPAIVYGILADTRDGQIYRTVKIGNQVWMAENLNYRNGTGADSGWWQSGSPDSGSKYGRLYTWTSLMKLPDSCKVKACANQVQSLHRGICPTGWHVPSDSEWTVMQKVVDSANTTDGTKLKSTSGWTNYNGTLANGTDDHGFRALPGGEFFDGFTRSVGISGDWWSATEYDATFTAWVRRIRRDYVYRYSYDKTNGFSERCLEDH